MKKPSSLIATLILLAWLSGCDDTDNTTDTAPDSSQPKAGPKLSERSAPAPNPADDQQDAAEEVGPIGAPAPPLPDMEAEKYDDDSGMPNPEAGDAVSEGHKDE